MNPDFRTQELLRLLQARIGDHGLERISLPVTLNDIVRWAIAVYWPEKPPRQFWDEEFARTTRWGGIVAPSEFNPFAWSLSGTRSVGVGLFIPGYGALNGASESSYFEQMRPGDVIHSNSEILDVYQKTGTTGALTFCVSEDRWTNQRNEPVRTIKHTIIYR